MRLPLAISIKSRNGMVTKDAVIINAVIESDPTSGESDVYKRPGNNDLGLIRSGKAQLLYYWNGIKAIIGDFLATGIPTLFTRITTWNTSDKGATITLSGANLTTVCIQPACLVRSVLATTSSWYWELNITSGATSFGNYLFFFGLTDNSQAVSTDARYLNKCVIYYIDASSASLRKNTTTFASGVTPVGSPAIMGIYFDAGAGTVNFYVNGVSIGIVTGVTAPVGGWYAVVGPCNDINANTQMTANFGATAFTYQPSALSTTLSPSTPNLPFSAQDNGSNAATAYLMLKNANQAWTLTTASATPTLIADSNYPGTYAVTLTSLTLVGTVATATMAANTNFQVGSTVTVSGATPVAYNGAQIITGVTPQTAVITESISITITRNGTIATATATLKPHGYATGQTVTISGANDTGYDNDFVITYIDANNFSFTVAVVGSDLVSPATGSLTLGGQYISAVGKNTTATPTVFVLNVSGVGEGYLQNGDTVTIGGVSGTGTVSGVAGSAFTVTCPSNTTIFFGSFSVRPTPVSVSSITYANGNATVTTSAAHKLNFLDTSLCYISGATQQQYNKSLANINITSTTTFVYPVKNTATPESPATGNIIAFRKFIVGASFTFTVAGSPASPATGTITAVGGRNTVTGIVYINGYFCVMDVFGVIYSSSPDNPSVWPPLSYTTAQAENGAGVCLARSQSYVVAFKEWSTEFFYDAGNKIGSPLSPVSNGFIKIGCASGASIAELEDELIWLSQTRQKGRGVYAMRGIRQEKISTSDVDIILNRDNLSEVFAYAIKISGHGLYILTLVNTNITLVYDMASQSWSLWSSLTLNASQSISTITQTNGIATVTFAAAHNIADGDPIAISGATQSNYNGSFQASYISPTVLTINVNSATVTPATGTILGAGYTESYFQFSKFANALGQYLVLHNTNGHLYEIKPEIYQDAGIPINTFFRTIRLDGGDLSSKRMAQIDVVGDFMTDVIMVRQSDDDSVSFSLYRPVNLAEDEPMIRRLGSYRRRSLELKHNGNNPLRLTALDLT